VQLYLLAIFGSKNEQIILLFAVKSQNFQNSLCETLHLVVFKKIVNVNNYDNVSYLLFIIFINYVLYGFVTCYPR